MSLKHTPQAHPHPIKSDDGYETNSREADNSIDSSAEILKKYGIKRVPVDYFHVGAFRYSNLDDAIAQAKRLNRDAP